MFSVCHLPRLAGQPLREESQRRGDDRREGGNNHEAQPPGAQPALVTLPEASLETRQQSEAASRAGTVV